MTFAIRSLALPLFAVGSLALTGCGSQGDTVTAKDVSVEEVAEKVAQIDAQPKPGRWEAKLKVSNIEMTGVPPQIQELMKKEMGKEQTWRHCLTPEQAGANNGEFFKPKDNQGCKYNNFKMGGGKIEADMTCGSDGTSQNMTMAGTYGSDAYDIESSTEGSMNGNKLTMTSSVSARRVGECDGTEQS